MKRFLVFIIIVLIVISSRKLIGVQSTFNNDNDNNYTYCTSTDQFINETKKQLLNRESNFIIEVPTSIYMVLKEQSKDTFHGILGLTYLSDDDSISTDSDYLERSIRSFKISTTTYSFRQKIKLNFDIKYLTTLSEETELNNHIEEALLSLKLSTSNDYKKTRKIHDYIVNKISFDESQTKYSAYNGMIENSGVCEAYALLAYRMFTDSGLETKIITGYAGGELHAWNIVKINDKWYNIDLTWDDPVTPDKQQYTRYDYFLKNENDFDDHTRDARYLTKDFLETYPISEKSYRLK
ncbi:MAG TPA: hypothetical protein GXZ90_09335 [Clostridiales bacterium]|nr:hypothetical protein [Clostridiales bacterium]